MHCSSLYMETGILLPLFCKFIIADILAERDAIQAPLCLLFPVFVKCRDFVACSVSLCLIFSQLLETIINLQWLIKYQRDITKLLSDLTTLPTIININTIFKTVYFKKCFKSAFLGVCYCFRSSDLSTFIKHWRLLVLKSVFQAFVLFELTKNHVGYCVTEALCQW